MGAAHLLGLIESAEPAGSWSGMADAGGALGCGMRAAAVGIR